MRAGDWHHRWLGYTLWNHGTAIAVEGQQNKLENTKPENRESDANYFCTWIGGPSLLALSQTISTISSYDLRSALTNS